MPDQEIALMAHLLRRAGYGASRDEIEARVTQGYDSVVAELLNPGDDPGIDEDLMYRAYPSYFDKAAIETGQTEWVYRMINNKYQLKEKMSLFWHTILCAGDNKVDNARTTAIQIDKFRDLGMGNFKDLLMMLSTDPAMLYYLDNIESHKTAVNENYGRELLELFSIGVGMDNEFNYSEDDVKSCARAFTGWTIGNREYMELRSQRDSDWPYGRISWHFEYRPEDHDNGEKEFLGQRGNFNGEDVIGIICQQEATARFISRHLYSFFVADEPGVPQWPYTPPADEQAIDHLTQVYFDSNYSITEMLRALFNSDYFKSESSWYTKVKSPVELVVGVARLTGEFDRPRREIMDRYLGAQYMGQWLNNPPSVEGWHQGTDWLDTGTLVERVNFATRQLGDGNKPGVRDMIGRITARDERAISPEDLVDACLDQVGSLEVSDDTRRELVDFASIGGEVRLGSGSPDKEARQRIVEVLQMVASTQEFQRS